MGDFARKLSENCCQTVGFIDWFQVWKQNTHLDDLAVPSNPEAHSVVMKG
jgi:hypothetical protein